MPLKVFKALGKGLDPFSQRHFLNASHGIKLILILNLINVMLEKWIYQIMEVKQVNNFCVRRP